MSEGTVSFRGIGNFADLCPEWYKDILKAIEEARQEGWNLKTDIVFEGHPYVWEGDPKMSSWSIEADPS